LNEPASPSRQPAVRFALLAVVLVLAALVLPPVSAGATRSGSSASAGLSSRPFASDSAWNSYIPARPALDPNSARWVGYLSQGQKAQSALLDETGVPIYYADASTPRQRVTCTRSYGRCPTEAVPLPPHVRPASGADGALVVIDLGARRHYDFWQLRWVEGQWVCSWCDSGSLDSDGRDSLTVGAGVSRLAGVVRTEEIRKGRIDHALVFASSVTAPAFRYPARKSDGANLSGVALPLPAGARIQLDPALDVDRIPGITPAEKTVARALQRFGAYNVDNGGYRSMGFSFETPLDGSDPYRSAGLPYDYAGMPHIPWDRLRVLRQWDGQ